VSRIQDILKKYGDSYQTLRSMSVEQKKAFEHILSCRTEKSGIHVDICEECGYERIAYNSCRDRHCPQCQTFRKEEWINDRKAELLGTQYFHLVFTIPDTLNVLTMQNREVLYSILFKASSETVRSLAQDPRFIGALPGFILVLHTWGQNLDFHPHIHCIVTGGGLTDMGEWKSGGKKFFVPVKVMSKLLRGKFLHYLKEAYKGNKLKFFGSMADTGENAAFQQLLDSLYQKDWYTYAKEPFSGPEAIIEYLGRYTHRVAISDNRITNMENGQVTFKWKDYRDGNKQKEMTLDAEEFIRRFLLHVLPLGFMKIRYYGILANRNKKTKLVLCRKLTQILNNPSVFKKLSKCELLLKVTNGKAFLCPCCMGHKLKRMGCTDSLMDTT
jgi:hypothetical protein